MDHPECDVITYEEYQKIKSKLLADAKALCKAKSYWAVCVAIKTVRNMYVVNKNTGYLFVANSDTEYYHKLEDWNFDGALVITVYLHEIDATTFTKYPSSYVKASSDIRYMDFKGRIPKKIKDATLEYMDTDGVSLADAFEWACKEYAPKGSELWKAWYYNDYRKFIPSAYDPKYLDFNKYPLGY